MALVAEGPTDAIIIEAALTALLSRPFILTLLQPEPTRPAMGTGWGGVLRWCQGFAGRGAPDLESDPALPGFDLFILHTDADVAEGSYGEVSSGIAALAASSGWPPLPQRRPCPPPTGAADTVRGCVLSWAGLPAPGPQTVLCVPSKAVDAWLAAATLDDGHALLNGLECNLNVAGRLAVLPKAARIPKTARDYRAHARTVTARWATVRQRCTQAERFSVEVEAALRGAHG